MNEPADLYDYGRLGQWKDCNADRYIEDKDWIVIELNPDRDLLYSFAAKLYDQKNLKDLFIKAKLDLSVLRIGVSIEKSNPFLIFRGNLY